jgi:hypothetical protein
MIQERKPLPTKEQIRAIIDIESLQTLLDEVVRNRTKIETDLEFRSDGDSAWEARARGAHTVHKITEQNIREHIYRLTRKGSSQPELEAIQQAAKASKRTASQAILQTAAEQKRAKMETARVLALNRIKEDIKRFGFLQHFLSVASEKLDPHTFSEITKNATERIQNEVLKVAERE